MNATARAAPDERGSLRRSARRRAPRAMWLGGSLVVALSCSTTPRPHAAGLAAADQRAAGTAEMQGRGARQEAFSTAMSRYAIAVNDFAEASPDETVPTLRRAFDALADSIAAIPRSDGLDAPDMAAGIHGLAAQFERERYLSVDQTRVAQDLLQRAEGIFTVAAEHQYVDAPSVAVAVQALHLQNGTIDLLSPLALELPEVLGSLRSIHRVLEAMAEFAGP